MAELTFKTNIRREKWSRRMKGLHEHLTQIYADSQPEPEYGDYERLRKRIFEYLSSRQPESRQRSNDFVFVVKGKSGFGVTVCSNNKKLITYYIE